MKSQKSSNSVDSMLKKKKQPFKEQNAKIKDRLKKLGWDKKMKDWAEKVEYKKKLNILKIWMGQNTDKESSSKGDKPDEM